MQRRKFLQKGSLVTIATALGAEVVFGKNLFEGYLVLGLQNPDPFKLFKKDSKMVLLNDKPWNMEAQAHLLDDKITPNRFMFIRNNGKIPVDIDATKWTITFDGESIRKKKSYTLQELKSKFKQYTYQLTLECGGNGRSEFEPPAKGNQWTVGAVACAEWTGVRLKDILADVGYKDDAIYIGYHAADTHLSGDPTKEPISKNTSSIIFSVQNEWRRHSFSTWLSIKIGCWWLAGFCIWQMVERNKYPQ